MTKTSVVLCCVLTAATASAQTISAAITGGGTTNYIAKWSSSTNLTTSALCQSASGGLVGIGTCSPTQKLQVNSGNVLVKGVNNFTANGQTAKYYVGDTNHAIRAVYGSGLALDTYRTMNAMTISDSGGHVTIAGGLTTTGFTGIDTGGLTVAPSSGAGPFFIGDLGDGRNGLGFGDGTTLMGNSGQITILLPPDVNSPGISLGNINGKVGIRFADGTVQTTAYAPAAATVKQTEALKQLQSDREALVRIVQQLQARVALLERARR